MSCSRDEAILSNVILELSSPIPVIQVQGDERILT